MTKTIRLGTRQSTLALKQADITKKAILDLHPNIHVNIVPISTLGDEDKESSLRKIGGKGVFVKSIEKALINDDIDIAVHSLKDVTSKQKSGLKMSGYLAPEAVEDVLCAKHDMTLLDLPPHARIATGSARRKALIKIIRPDITVVDIRGNVETRLNKLESDPNLDAIILSKAGLIRLGLMAPHFRTLDKHTFVPAPGQGVIGLQTREDDDVSSSLCAAISPKEQTLLSDVELYALEQVGFDCSIPFGVYCQQIDDDRLRLNVFVSNESVTEWIDETLDLPIKDRYTIIKKESAKWQALLD